MPNFQLINLIMLAVVVPSLYLWHRSVKINEKLVGEIALLHADLRDARSESVQDAIETWLEKTYPGIGSMERDLKAFGIESRLKAIVRGPLVLRCAADPDTDSCQGTDIERCKHCGSHKNNPHWNSCKGWDVLNKRSIT